MRASRCGRTRRLAPENPRFATFANPSSSSRSASSRCATRSAAGRSSDVADAHAPAVDPPAAGADEERSLLADEPRAEPAALEHQPGRGEQLALVVADEVAEQPERDDLGLAVGARLPRLRFARCRAAPPGARRGAPGSTGSPTRGRSRSPPPGRSAARSRRRSDPGKAEHGARSRPSTPSTAARRGAASARSRPRRQTSARGLGVRRPVAGERRLAPRSAAGDRPAHDDELRVERQLADHLRRAVA